MSITWREIGKQVSADGVANAANTFGNKLQAIGDGALKFIDDRIKAREKSMQQTEDANTQYAIGLLNNAQSPEDIQKLKDSGMLDTGSLQQTLGGQYGLFNGEKFNQARSTLEKDVLTRASALDDTQDYSPETKALINEINARRASGDIQGANTLLQQAQKSGRISLKTNQALTDALYKGHRDNVSDNQWAAGHSLALSKLGIEQQRLILDQMRYADSKVIQNANRFAESIQLTESLKSAYQTKMDTLQKTSLQGINLNDTVDVERRIAEGDQNIIDYFKYKEKVDKYNDDQTMLQDMYYKELENNGFITPNGTVVSTGSGALTNNPAVTGNSGSNGVPVSQVKGNGYGATIGQENGALTARVGSDLPTPKGGEVDTVKSNTGNNSSGLSNGTGTLTNAVGVTPAVKQQSKEQESSTNPDSTESKTLTSKVGQSSAINPELESPKSQLETKVSQQESEPVDKELDSTIKDAISQATSQAIATAASDKAPMKKGKISSLGSEDRPTDTEYKKPTTTVTRNGKEVEVVSAQTILESAKENRSKNQEESYQKVSQEIANIDSIAKGMGDSNVDPNSKEYQYQTKRVEAKVNSTKPLIDKLNTPELNNPNGLHAFVRSGLDELMPELANNNRELYTALHNAKSDSDKIRILQDFQRAYAQSEGEISKIQSQNTQVVHDQYLDIGSSMTNLASTSFDGLPSVYEDFVNSKSREGTIGKISYSYGENSLTINGKTISASNIDAMRNDKLFAEKLIELVFPDGGATLFKDYDRFSIADVVKAMNEDGMSSERIINGLKFLVHSADKISKETPNEFFADEKSGTVDISNTVQNRIINAFKAGSELDPTKLQNVRELLTKQNQGIIRNSQTMSIMRATDAIKSGEYNEENFKQSPYRLNSNIRNIATTDNDVKTFRNFKDALETQARLIGKGVNSQLRTNQYSGIDVTLPPMALSAVYDVENLYRTEVLKGNQIAPIPLDVLPKASKVVAEKFNSPEVKGVMEKYGIKPHELGREVILPKSLVQNLGDLSTGNLYQAQTLLGKAIEKADNKDILIMSDEDFSILQKAYTLSKEDKDKIYGSKLKKY